MPPMTISYAQNMEDWTLAQVFAGQREGFYVDVGAGHPVGDNVTFWHYLQGWRGIVVEPQKRLAALYAHVRPRDRVFRGVLGRSIGDVTFHVVDGMHGFSTTVEANARGAAAFGAGFSSVTSPMTTLAALCAEHDPPGIDVLKIDVEGAEAEVLAGNDFTRWRPRVVLAEAVAPGSMAPAWDAFEPILIDAGYRFVFFDGLNRFYVERSEDELAARFPTEKGDWGSVRHLYDCGRAPERPDHPDHALATRLVMGFLARLPTLDPALLATLLAETPRSDAGDGDPATLLASDAGRAALGRIATPYDGGLLMED